MEKPNILLIMTDQQRWDSLGCTGGWVNTPNIDKVAREGVIFSNCVTTAPSCVPARISMARGLYPHNTGIWKNIAYDLPARAPTWMREIRKAGYRTSLFGKSHLHFHGGDLRDKEGLMHALGMDDVNEIGGPQASRVLQTHMTEEWERKGLWEAYGNDILERKATKPHMVRPSTLGLEDYYDTYVGRQAKAYLEQYKRSEPWFCWVSFGGPHEPWDTPEPYASMYDPGAMPEAVKFQSGSENRPRGRLDQVWKNRRVDFEEGEVGRLRADYAGNVTLIDDQVGEILQVIEQRGELHNTAVVFVSDHGELNGDYNLLHKGVLLNGAVRVPLIVRTPESAASKSSGTKCADPVEWMDVGPTLVELAGGEIKHQQFAKSFVPTLSDPDIVHREDAMSEVWGEIMLLNRQWKIVLNKDGAPYMLFRVDEDPDEVHNLVERADMRGVKAQLRSRILDRLVQSQVYEPSMPYRAWSPED